MGKKSSKRNTKKNSKESRWLKLRVGAEVKNGRIGNIFYATKSYIIYTTLEKPSVLTYDNDDHLEATVIRILPPLGRLRSHLFSETEKMNYLPQVAGAYVLAFQNKVEEATDLIDQIIKDCETRRADRNNAQITYLGICLIFVLIDIVAALILRYRTSVPSYPIFWLYFNIALWGSFGGFLSVTYKLNKYIYELNVSICVRALSAFSRIFIAILSSCIVFSLVRSNLVIGILNDSKSMTNIYFFYSLAVLSGFSESLIPDLLMALEKKSAETSESVSQK
jgi:hypothetical protein